MKINFSKQSLRHFIFIGLALNFSSLGQTKTKPQEEWPPAFLNCDDQKIPQFPKLAGAQHKELMELLHPEALIKTESEVEFVCVAGGKEWKWGKSKINILETQNYVKTKYGLDRGLGRIFLSVGKAKLQPPYKLSTHDEELSALDTAPYLVSANQYAFGIRLSQHFMYAGGGGANTYLQLFYIDNDHIVPILRTLMASSSLTAGDWQKDGSRDHQENDGGEALIELSKNKTNGFFDLIKKVKAKKMIYRWNGHEYISKDKEIIKDVNNTDD